jgi:hypothetical protein
VGGHHHHHYRHHRHWRPRCHMERRWVWHHHHRVRRLVRVCR